MTQDTLRLITRVLSKEAAAEEIHKLEEWKNASEANKACFNEFEDVWLKGHTTFKASDKELAKGMAYVREKIALSASLNKPSRSEDTALHKLRPADTKLTKLTKLSASSPLGRKQKQQLSSHLLKIAAALLLVCMAASGLYLHSSNKEHIEYKELKMAYGKRGSLQLSDGSIVQVNSGTKISFPKKFAQDARRVKVDGEAFFEVAKDANRPFIIEAGELEIKVLGTSFNLKSYRSEHIVEIGVKTGRVSVTQKSKIDAGNTNVFHLSPDELLSFNSFKNTFEKKKVDMDLVMSWTQETLVFDHKSFQEVANMLQRWYNIPIVLENQQLQHCIMIGEYKNEKLRNILEALKFSMDIDYQILKDEVRITGKGCETKKPSMEKRTE